MKTTINEPAPRSLADMYNRATRYEVVAVLPTGTFRIGFTSRVSKLPLLEMARDHSEAILPHIGEDDKMSYSRAGGWKLGAVIVKPSGRTERDVAAAIKHAS